MNLSTLSDWLSFIGSVHSKEIDLGLDRVKQVADRLGVLMIGVPVIIVGGTNGKGSTVAGLETIYRAANYKTGVFTSPFLFVYNEQVRINGKNATDEVLCDAFAKVESARGEISLSAFEFSTLAALIIFKNSKLDVYILEVGLGGRLDAVNILDADVAVITSIGIDHTEWLGNTREEIGREKAGIFRQGKFVVCGDENPPQSIIETAENLFCMYYQREKDFRAVENNSDWNFINQNFIYNNLPKNSLAIQNMASVIQVISLLQPKLPVTSESIVSGLKNVNLPGRIQIVKGDVTEIYDVSHNPHAIAFLVKKLNEINIKNEDAKIHAVFSMLEDKDIGESIKIIANKIDDWFVASLNIKRAASIELLKKSFDEAGIKKVIYTEDIKNAYQHAKEVSKSGDTILVFGSFHTVAKILKRD